MKRLLGRVSIVTGAAQGIGLATARRFLEDGAIVALCDIRRESVDAAVEALRELGTDEGFVVDVTPATAAENASPEAFVALSAIASWHGSSRPGSTIAWTGGSHEASQGFAASAAKPRFGVCGHSDRCDIR